MPTGKRYIGIIAQDVNPYAPYIIDTTYDYLNAGDSITVPILTANHEPLFFAAINAIKQLAERDSMQENTIDSLKQQLMAIQSCIDNFDCGGSNKTKVDSDGAMKKIKQQDVELKTDVIILDQNNPNPFKESTTITYFIPDFVNYAQIIFSDNTGRIINTVDIDHKGNGQLNVKAEKLNTGMYSYSIVIDGQVIDTKKMLKTK